jgi:hypothetical protein
VAGAIAFSREQLERAGKPVRLHPAAARFSMGDGWMSDGMVIDLRGVRPAIERHDSGGHTYFCVAAGHTIHDVIQALEPHGFALESSTNFTGVTYIGAAQTCSHGSGPALAPMGAQIRAYEVADGYGLLRGVQSPADRVLERVGYRGVISTRQDELDALGVSLGALGIITRVWLEPVKDYWLRDTRWHTSWRIARRLMLEGEAYRHHAQSYLIVPYAREDGERSCSVSTNDKLPLPLDGRAPHQESLRTLLPQAANLVAYLPLFARSPRRIPRLLERGLTVFNGEREVEGPASAMLGQHYYGFPPSGCGLELSVPYGTPDTRRRAVQMIDALLEQIDVLRADDRYVGGFISVRFSKQWDAPLSLSQGSDACHVELLMLKGTPRGRETLVELKQSLAAFSPRLHFGLLHSASLDDVARAYPLLGEFQKVAARVDPLGVFANGLSDRLGLTGPRAQVDRRRLSRVG